MRKRILHPPTQRSEPLPPFKDCLELERLAQVEITSEDVAFPIESALLPGTGSGWRAAYSGEQTIRLLFDEPQKLSRISLLFEETGAARTQEFVLRSRNGRRASLAGDCAAAMELQPARLTARSRRLSCASLRRGGA